MLSIKSTNLWQDVTKDTTIVHGANINGIMGAGFALQLRTRYPGNYNKYREFCLAGKAILGDIFLYNSANTIVNLFSQEIYRPAKLSAIRRGLISTHNVMKAIGKHILLSPAIGCGIGKLNFADVYNVYSDIFGNSDVNVIVYYQGK